MESQFGINQITDTLKILTSETANLIAGGNVEIQSQGGNTNIQGARVNLNSGGAPAEADPAEAADPKNEFNAYLTNRIPDHEPWARTDTRNDTTVDPLLDYADQNVGKKRRVTATSGTGDETQSSIVNIERGTNWRR